MEMGPPVKPKEMCFKDMIGLERAFESTRMMLCCFLLLTSAGSANSGKRDAFREQAFTLFSNTDVDNNDREVNLYKKITESVLIATWTWKNGPIELHYMRPGYNGRIHMDGSKNIWIWTVDENDTAKYCIKCSKTDKGIEVELNVLEKKWTEEEIKNWLDAHPEFKKTNCGKLEDKIKEEYFSRLEEYFKNVERKLTTVIIGAFVLRMFLDVSWCTAGTKYLCKKMFEKVKGYTRVETGGR